MFWGGGEACSLGRTVGRASLLLQEPVGLRNRSTEVGHRETLGVSVRERPLRDWSSWQYSNSEFMTPTKKTFEGSSGRTCSHYGAGVPSQTLGDCEPRCLRPHPPVQALGGSPWKRLAAASRREKKMSHMTVGQLTPDLVMTVKMRSTYCRRLSCRSREVRPRVSLRPRQHQTHAQGQESRTS